MTPEQFEALAQLMRLRQSASREALRLVLVDGVTHSAAADFTRSLGTDVKELVRTSMRVIELALITTFSTTETHFDWGRLLMPEGPWLIKEEKDGETTWTDRRNVEIQFDGSYILRDPVTGKTYNTKTGAESRDDRGLRANTGVLMNSDQFNALAKLMRLRQSPSCKALRLVLVDGLTHAAAAERAGSIRTDVTRLVSSAKRTIDLARTVTHPGSNPPQPPAA